MEQQLTPQVLFLGLAGISAIAGLALFVASKAAGKHLPFLTRPITPIAQSQPGPVHLAGEIIPDDDDFDLLDAPMSHKPCLFSRLVIELETNKAADILMSANHTYRATRAARKKEENKIADKSLRRAIIDDGTGRVEVSLRKADIVIKTDIEGRTGGFRADDPGVERALRLHGVEVKPGEIGKNYLVTEMILEPGDQINVFGVLEPGQERGKVVGSKAERLLLTDFSPDELTKKERQKVTVRKVGGVFLWILAAGLVVVSLMVSMQKPPPGPTKTPPPSATNMQPL